MRLIATGGFAHVDSKGRRCQGTLPALSLSFRSAECGYDKSEPLVHTMNPEPKLKKPLRWRIVALMVQFAAVAITLNAVLILFGVIPNPAEQRREVDAVTYRILSDGYASGSPDYRAAIRDAVKGRGGDHAVRSRAADGNVGQSCAGWIYRVPFCRNTRIRACTASRAGEHRLE